MRLTTALLLLLATVLPAAAVTIVFEQDGWNLGGPLRVAFTGVDSDSDGAISLPELTQFTATWRTPSEQESVWLLRDIQSDGFFFVDLSDYVLFVTNPEYSLLTAAFEGEALSSVFDEFLFPVDSSISPPVAVPEVASLPLAGLCLLVVGFIRLRAPSRR